MAQRCCHPRRLNQRQWPQTCHLSSEGPGGPRTLQDNTPESTHCDWARCPCLLPSDFANGRKQDILIVCHESCLYQWERSSLGPDGVFCKSQVRALPAWVHVPLHASAGAPGHLPPPASLVPASARKAFLLKCGKHWHTPGYSSTPPPKDVHPCHLLPKRTLYMATI